MRRRDEEEEGYRKKRRKFLHYKTLKAFWTRKRKRKIFSGRELSLSFFLSLSLSFFAFHSLPFAWAGFDILLRADSRVLIHEN